MRFRVTLALLLGICCTSLGDVAISQAMKTTGLFSLLMLGGVVCHAVFMLLYMYALKKEDLSFVLPLTAIDYVLVTLLAHFAVGEDVSSLRWAGTCLVAIGVGLNAKT